jgi:hypothetical protein
VPATAFVNCRVLTVSGGDGDAEEEALLVRGEHIDSVGSEKSILGKARPEDKVIDLGGAYVCPGFEDSHTHLSSTGLLEGGADLRGARDAEEAIARIRAKAAATSKGGWIFARGWDESTWDVKEYLTARDLDRATTKHLVLAYRVDGHLCSVNSKLLRTLKLPARDPRVGREKGRPNGVLKEEMAWLARERWKPSDEEMVEALDSAQARMLSLGVTSAHDIVSRDMRQTAGYSQLRAEGRLRLRVYLVPIYDYAMDLADQGLRTDFGDHWIRIGGVKIFTDGSLGAHTAALSAGYEDHRRNKGLLLFKPKKLRSMIQRLARAGFQGCPHAIGDVAIKEVLKAYRDAPRPGDRQHRIEHAELLDSEALETAKELNVALSMQPNFIGEWGHAGGMYENRLGDRVKWMNPFRRILDAGVTLGFGSDSMPPSALYGLRSAVEAPHPAQRISGGEALRCYTLEPAGLSGEAHLKGSLEVGKFADFVVLEEDPRRPPPAADSRVLAAWVAGKIAWRSKSAD